MTVATFTLANVWILHEEAPELTWAQALAASARAQREYGPKIAAALQQALADTPNRRESSKAIPKPSPARVRKVGPPNNVAGLAVLRFAGRGGFVA